MVGELVIKQADRDRVRKISTEEVLELVVE